MLQLCLSSFFFKVEIVGYTFDHLVSNGYRWWSESLHVVLWLLQLLLSLFRCCCCWCCRQCGVIIRWLTCNSSDGFEFVCPIRVCALVENLSFSLLAHCLLASFWFSMEVVAHHSVDSSNSFCFFLISWFPRAPRGC